MYAFHCAEFSMFDLYKGIRGSPTGQVYHPISITPNVDRKRYYIYIYSFLYRKERKRRRNWKKCTIGNETQEPKTHPNSKTAPTIGNEVILL